MLQKRKICVVLINRANYGRLKSVLSAIVAHPDLELQIVVGSSMLVYQYGRAVDQVEKDGFKVNETLHMHVAGETPVTMAKSLGLAFIELPSIFSRLKPDVVLVNADRYETLAIAASAAYMNIPVAHALGGELTGTIDDYVRHAVTKFSDFHFTAHETAARRVTQMGENPDRVFVVGNPSLDCIHRMEPPLYNEHFWAMHGGTGEPIDISKPFLLCVFHPVTTEYGNNYYVTQELFAALDECALPVIVLWPNNDAGSDEVTKAMRERKERGGAAPMHFFRNLSVEDYLKLLEKSACIVGNSSSGIMEAGFLGVPCVNIGSRQQGREQTRNVTNAGVSRKEIIETLRLQLAHGAYEPDYFFGDGNAGTRVADILARVPLNERKKFYHMEGVAPEGLANESIRTFTKNVSI